MNKLKGYGTSLEGWQKWGDIWVISPKVKNIFDFTFSLYINQLERGKWDKFLSLSFPIPVSLFSHHFHLLSSSPLLKISSTSSFLAFKVCFLEFLHLFFMFALDDCWWELFKSWECFIFMNLCLIEKEYQGFEAVY